MKSLAIETIQTKDGNSSYQIKPLSQMQIAEVLADGVKLDDDGNIKLNGDGMKACIKYGLANQADLSSMPYAHIMEVATAILLKAVVTEEERKN